MQLDGVEVIDTASFPRRFSLSLSAFATLEAGRLRRCYYLLVALH